MEQALKAGPLAAREMSDEFESHNNPAGQRAGLHRRACSDNADAATALISAARYESDEAPSSREVNEGGRLAIDTHDSPTASCTLARVGRLADPMFKRNTSSVGNDRMAL